MDTLRSKWLCEDTLKLLKFIRLSLPNKIDDYVIWHSDLHQWNILCLNLDKTEIRFIDFECTHLGFKEYDLASIFCEITTDNAHPVFPYTKFYAWNWLEESEFTYYANYYLSLYHRNIYKGDLDEKSYIESSIDQFLDNIYRWMILYAFHFGIAAILVLEDETINDEIYNFGFVENRIKLVELLLSKDFIKSRLKLTEV